MAEDRMAVLDMLRKATADGNVDILREGVRVLAGAIMEAEVSELTGAAKGERAPDRRLTNRNGYRERRWAAAAWNRRDRETFERIDCLRSRRSDFAARPTIGAHRQLARPPDSNCPTLHRTHGGSLAGPCPSGVPSQSARRYDSARRKWTCKSLAPPIVASRNHPSMSTHGMPSAAQASGIATRGEVRTLIRNDHHTARPHACVALAFLDLY